MASGFWNFWIFWVPRFFAHLRQVQLRRRFWQCQLCCSWQSSVSPGHRCRRGARAIWTTSSPQMPTDGHSRYEVMDMTLYLPTYTPCVCVRQVCIYIYNYIYVYVHMSNLLRVRARCLAIMISQKPRCGPALNIWPREKSHTSHIFNAARVLLYWYCGGKIIIRCMWLIGASQLLTLVCYTICQCLVLGLICKIFPMSEEAEVDVVPEARRSWDWYYLCLADELVVKHCRILWVPLPCRHRTGKGKHKKHKRKEQGGTQATSFP